jgi:gluconate 5-dehydrogenase
MSHPVFDIRERVALVTGSSRGIGRALAQCLDESRLRGRTQRARRVRPYSDTQGIGRTHRRHGARGSFDVTDPTAVADGIARIEKRVGTLDILVNNTGAQHRRPFTEFPTQDWYRLLDTNLGSAFLLGREVANRMVSRSSGKSSTFVRCKARPSARESHRTRRPKAT